MDFFYTKTIDVLKTHYIEVYIMRPKLLYTC